MKHGRSLALGLFVIVLGAILFGAIESTVNTRPEQKVQAPQAAQTPTPLMPESHPLTKQAAAIVLSEYLGALQPKLVTWEIMREIYLSKLQQDTQWKALDKFREDAEAFKNAAQQVQKDIYAIPREGEEVFSQEDGAALDAVSSAADDLIVADVTLAVDVAVFANTGLSDLPETIKDAKDAKRARRAFQAAAMSAYRHFGYAPTQIDRLTLQPKQAAVTK